MEYVGDDLKFIKGLNSKYIISTVPIIIEVDKNFPKISNDEFINLKFHERISDIKYRLNVDGLGQNLNNDNFKKVIRVMTELR